MTRILTVDDSRAIRSIVAKHMTEMGFDYDEAEDGEEGLARLEVVAYDLVVLDVTMPNLDGPGMLRRMREAGNRTPVLMLTSESKRAIIADVMRQGIEDYILKPFKPDELKNKIRKILAHNGAEAGAEAARPAPAPAAAPDEPPAAAGKQFVDVLLIDDMENVAKKLRSYLPQHLTMQSSVSANSALAMCRERVYRVILIDTDIPDVNSVTLMGQVRLLQPHASCLALSLRSVPDAEKQALGDGFEDVLLKPFQPASIEDFLLRYFDNQTVLFQEENVLRAGPYTGRDDRVERYFRRLQTLTTGALEKLAAACHDDVILELTRIPLRPELVVRYVVEVAREAGRLGLVTKAVGTPEAGAILKQITDTSDVPFCTSVDEARRAA